MFKPVPKEYERDNWRDIAIKIDNQRDSEDEENEQKNETKETAVIPFEAGG